MSFQAAFLYLVLLFVCPALAGCGQSGCLYLPKPGPCAQQPGTN